MKLLQRVLGAVLVLAGGYLFTRALGHGSFVPLPLLMFGGGLMLLFGNLSGKPPPRGRGVPRAMWFGYAMLGAAVAWAWASSIVSDNVLVIFGGAAVLGAVGVVLLAIHHLVGFREELKSISEQTPEG